MRKQLLLLETSSRSPGGEGGELPGARHNCQGLACVGALPSPFFLQHPPEFPMRGNAQARAVRSAAVVGRDATAVRGLEPRAGAPMLIDPERLPHLAVAFMNADHAQEA